jgi:hypothetical protein
VRVKPSALFSAAPPPPPPPPPFSDKRADPPASADLLAMPCPAHPAHVYYMSGSSWMCPKSWPPRRAAPRRPRRWPPCNAEPGHRVVCATRHYAWVQLCGRCRRNAAATSPGMPLGTVLQDTRDAVDAQLHHSAAPRPLMLTHIYSHLDFDNSVARLSFAAARQRSFRIVGELVRDQLGCADLVCSSTGLAGAREVTAWLPGRRRCGWRRS